KCATRLRYAPTRTIFISTRFKTCQLYSGVSIQVSQTRVSGVSLWPEGLSVGVEAYRLDAVKNGFQISVLHTVS
ncbi:MAG: hypothetical protein OET21_18120, partial [Desulfobacterales bacterium]|nr:hypothetical protein [Desulfobacterales bacterium]